MSNLSSQELHEEKIQVHKKRERKLYILKLADKLYAENVHSLSYGMCVTKAEEAQNIKDNYIKGE